MKFGSLFAGIGGFDVGLARSGMECVWQIEKDAHCKSVLARHWPSVPRLDDVREASTTRLVRPDWIVGGFPCQDLSVAGKRAGLAGERSGLFFEFIRIIREFAPSGVLIENVPGLLSSNGGRDFGTVIGKLAECGYGFAYRILDAQYFGVPQRRRRVFIVGCLGDWRCAAEILFERESVPWNPPPSRASGPLVARAIAQSSVSSGYRYDANGEDFVTSSLCNNGKAAGSATQQDAESGMLVTHTLSAEGADASEDGTGRGTPIIPILEVSGGTSSRGAGPNGAGIGNDGDPMFTLQAAHQHGVAIPLDMRQLSRGDKFTNNRTDGGPPGTGIGQVGDPSPSIATSHTPAICTFDERNVTSRENRSVPRPELCHTLHADAPVAFQTRISRNGRGQPKDITDALTSCEGGTHADSKPHIAGAFGVRRLTPRECERLQGFDDDWTRWAADGMEIADGPRYRMLGNAVNGHVSDWLGRRITTV